MCAHSTEHTVQCSKARQTMRAHSRALDPKPLKAPLNTWLSPVARFLLPEIPHRLYSGIPLLEPIKNRLGSHHLTPATPVFSIADMAMISPSELERRLLGWLSNQVLRYPFFEASIAPRATGAGARAPGSGLSLPISPISTAFSSPSGSPLSSPSASRYASASSSLQDLNQWYNYVETASTDCRVPVEQYPDVALYLLRGDLKEVMQERKGEYLKQTKKSFWDWSDFKEDLRRIVGECRSTSSSCCGRHTMNFKISIVLNLCLSCNAG